MRKLVLAVSLFAALLSYADNDTWLYWLVDSTASGIEFYGAQLYSVQGTSGPGEKLGEVMWAANAPTKNLDQTNLWGLETFDMDSQGFGSQIGDLSFGTSFYVELVNMSGETVGWWQGDYMTFDTLTALCAIEGIVSGATQQGQSFKHNTAWVADQFSPIPEPTSGLLVLMGGALLALRRRRKLVL